MGLLNRLLGRRSAEVAPTREPPSPLSLQLLFPGRLRLDINTLTRALQGLHPSLAGARFELDAHASGAMEAEVGTARWGRHAVQVVVFSGPMPAEAVERCVAPAHYGAELKAQARAHGSHALLFYRGEEQEPLEQYVALALVAVALAAEGALVVMNESAHTSFPAQPLVPEPGDDVLELLRTLPLTALYVGFVKQEVQGVKGVWMRTYGGPRMGLPDLAWHARGHEEGREAFNLFSGLLAYLRSSGARFKDGDTAELDARHVRLRRPRADEAFLDAQGELFVLEPRGPVSPG
jgi:hypothetical protein